MTKKEKRRLEVVWETREITTISFSQNRRTSVFCRSCRADAPLLSVDEVAAAANISEAAVLRLADAGLIHSTKTASGSLMICGDFSQLKTKISGDKKQ